MEDLKSEIAKKIKELEIMIQKGENKEKIDKQRDELDSLLEEYLKDI